ncbi:small ribosomal subunit Rsm22 family protein [Salana multivorans]
MPVTIPLPTALAGRVAQLRSGPGTNEDARRLSERYRADRPASSPIMAGAAEATAYALTRLPATFAAARFALEELALVAPDLAPRTLLDVGAGTGAATAAAWATWDSLESATLEDYSAAALAVARDVLAGTDLAIETRLARIGTDRGASGTEPADVAVAAYVLSEIDDAERRALLDRLTAGARSAVVVIEPGTPAGFRRILDARADLLHRGWRIAAPCPHELTCPVAALSEQRGGDWCHAAVRLPRTREHRAAKGGERGFEDEKLAYVAALAPGSGLEPTRPVGRVLRHPETRSGHIRLELCTREGELERATVTKRDKDAFRAARKIEWGEAWEL